MEGIAQSIGGFFSPFGAGVQGALHAYLPKKSEGEKNLGNNNIELFVGVI